MRLSGGIQITLCVIRSMSDVESPMRFELAHSVPNLFKFLHFVTSLLIAYDGPEAHFRRLDCLNIKNFISCTKSFFADGIQTKYHASNVVGV